MIGHCSGFDRVAGRLRRADGADLAALVSALGADNVRWVGGAVRDTLLGAPVRDIDAATPLRPEEVIERCKVAGIRTIPTGIDHGTITALLDGGSVEVTTLRHDVSTDGRRATVAFANDWREDAARRDFTINALYAHPETLQISDYFGGLDDLDARRVRFIGDPHERIREDHLRILRYYRFQARFGAPLLDPQLARRLTTFEQGTHGMYAVDGIQTFGVWENAEDGLKAIENGGPDVVLMDISLPGMSGIEATVCVKEKHSEMMWPSSTSMEGGEGKRHMMDSGGNKDQAW